MEHQVTTLLPVLPFEVIIEMLLRLRVKTLLRFRAVCKEWCCLIDSTKFLYMHLSRSKQNKMNCSLIAPDERKKSILFSIDLKSLEEVVEFDVSSWWPEDRWHRFCGVGACSSCNGLVCLSSSATNIVLWNPSTKKHLVLPPLIFDDDLQLVDDDESTIHSALGFGFDAEFDDYKVVGIEIHYNLDGKYVDTEVKVYSLRSNSWRRVHDFPKGHFYHSYGVFVEESLHWLVTELSGSWSEYSILAFNLTTEEIKFFSIPSNTFSEICWVSIGIIEGCLSVSFFDTHVGLDLWILNEYGSEDSWIKLICIHDPILIARFKILPILYMKNFGILLIAKSNGGPTEVYWHKFGSQSTEKVPLGGFSEHFWKDILFVESLVRLENYGH